MSDLRGLRIALFITGLIFLFALYPFINIWPVEGWRWTPEQREYEEMIVGIYATLGLFLIWAVKEPLKHLSLIWFTVWSSAVHATIMTWQALRDSSEHAHLWGDIPALFLIAAVLGWLTWKR